MENKIQMQKNDELQKYQFYSQIHLCIFYRKINFSLIFTFLLKKRERIKKKFCKFEFASEFVPAICKNNTCGLCFGGKINVPQC